jgi:hypothetical protein
MASQVSEDWSRVIPETSYVSYMQQTLHSVWYNTFTVNCHSALRAHTFHGILITSFPFHPFLFNLFSERNEVEIPDCCSRSIHNFIIENQTFLLPLVLNFITAVLTSFSSQEQVIKARSYAIMFPLDFTASASNIMKKLFYSSAQSTIFFKYN